MAFKDLIPWRNRPMSALRSPFETMRGFVEPMERLLEAPWAGIGRAAATIDVDETPREIVVSARVPGFSRDEISVDVTETSVTLRGEAGRTSERRKHGFTGRVSERRSFVHRMTLPAPVKTAEAKASFKGETLEVRLPRVKETEVRRIDID